MNIKELEHGLYQIVYNEIKYRIRFHMTIHGDGHSCVQRVYFYNLYEFIDTVHLYPLIYLYCHKG